MAYQARLDEPKYPWRDHTSLVCRRTYQKGTIRYYNNQIQPSKHDMIKQIASFGKVISKVELWKCEIVAEGLINVWLRSHS